MIATRTNWMLTAAVSLIMWNIPGASAQDHNHDHAGQAHAAQGQVDPETLPSATQGTSPEVMKWLKDNQQNRANPTQPGPAHKELQHFVGTWDVTVKMGAGAPNAPESKGTAVVDSILDGRFIREHMQSKLPMAPGVELPLEGWGTLGYDNYRNMYVGSWCDSMSTYLFNYKGLRNPESGVYTYFGEMDEPELAIVGRHVKMIVTIKDKDTHLWEMYDLHAGENYKVMEITYKRKK